MNSKDKWIWSEVPDSGLEWNIMSAMAVVDHKLYFLNTQTTRDDKYDWFCLDLGTIR